MTHYYHFTEQGQLKRLFAFILLLLCFFPVHAQLQGTYVIGGDSPDYSTINAAVADLTAEGVSGPVIFDLHTGTYEEQVTLGAITGASSIHTITFRAQSGNAEDVVISYAAVSAADNYVVQLRGASHYRIRNLTISAKGAEYNRAITLFEQVNDLLIEGSSVSAPRYAPFQSGQAVLYLESSLASDIRIRDNHITGGLIGVAFRGSSDGRPSGTVIADNVVEEFTAVGVSLIFLQGGSLTGNRIISTFTDNDVAVLEIRDWDGTAATPVLVANNFISVPKFQVGAYILNTDHLQFVHNSVYGGEYLAFELRNSRNIGVKNNIFRSDGYSAVYIAGTTSLDMDYNDLSASRGFLVRWERELVPNLAQWRNISGQDANSVSIDPEFVSTVDLHAQASALANAGVAIPEVPIDIDGEARDATPSIGADEFQTDCIQGNTTIYYADSDRDGFGDPAISVETCSQPMNYVSNSSDCDDRNAAIGEASVFYADKDGDGYGDAASTITSCNIPVGYAVQPGDCDDDAPFSYPGQTWYFDRDSDGYPESSTIDCLPPVGAVLASALSSVDLDNCPDTYNPDQADSDSDGLGNACDDTDPNTLRHFWLEAECGAVGSNWVLESNADASNGTFAYAPGQRSTTNPPADIADNLLRFVVEQAVAGEYYLHVRALTSPRDGDSFWVRANGGKWIKWNEIDCNRKFNWATLPATLDLRAGNNTVDFALREGKTMLDKVYLSMEANQPTGFGSPAANCSNLRNQAPTAVASSSVLRGTAPLTVNLDGSTSYDSDGQIVQYDWSWMGGNITGPTPMVTFAAGTYTIALKVTDNNGASNMTTIALEVTEPDGQADSPPFAFEAECGVRNRDWLLFESADASNGKFVSYTGCRCSGEPSTQRADQFLTYDFVTSIADTFYVFLRLDAPDVGRNSFWVRVDGGDWIKMWREADGRQLLTSGFEWRRVNDDARPVYFELAPGKHTVTVAPREPGTKLDKLLVSPTSAVPSGTGIPAQHCSMAKSSSMVDASTEVVHTYDDAMFTGTALAIYPNPTTDLLTVELNDGYTGQVTIAVIDAMGRQVSYLSRIKEDRQFRAMLPVGDLPPSIYYLQITQGDCQSVERFAKR